MARINRDEYRFKVVIIGSLGCGKTSFVGRYVSEQFSHNYKSTIGVDFQTKIIDLDRQTRVHLQLWDVAGQERFGSMTDLYYKDSVGVLLLFDITNQMSFDAVASWREDFSNKILKYSERRIPMVLVANKADLVSAENPGVSDQVINDFCESQRENGVVGWFKTSALANVNVDDSMNTLLNRILVDVVGLPDSSEEDTNKVTPLTVETPKETNCCT